MKKVLFFPLFTTGHLNVCFTIAKRMLDLHSNEIEIYFLLDTFNVNKFQSRYAQIKWLTYTVPSDSQSTETQSTDTDPILDGVLKESKYWSLSPLDKETGWTDSFIEMIELFQVLEPTLNQKIQQVQPDLILIDQLFTCPIGINQNVPWVLINSSAENFVGQDNFPPCKSGLPADDQPETRALWQDFRQKYSEGVQKAWDVLNKWLAKYNLSPLRPGYWYNLSPYLNICNTPKAISLCRGDVQLQGNWARLQSALLPPTASQLEQMEQFKIEFQFEADKPIVYFSFGSMAFVRDDLMRKVIDWLGKMDVQVIVSAGTSAEKLKQNCPKNVRVARHVPQSLFLKTVNLCITHGGNNTVTECLYWGVPTLTFPLFSDQHCNAARLVEKGLGRTLSLFSCSESEFREAVEELLNDENLTTRLQEISKEIQQNTGLDEVVDKVVALISIQV